MTVRELERMIMEAGWRPVAQVGSHRQYRHPGRSGKVTIPIHKGDINIKTANSILKQAGLK